MLSNIVKNIFFLLLSIVIMICFIGAIIASAVWLATSGELLIIIMIVAFVIGFAVILVYSVMSMKDLFECCQYVDNKLKDIKDND